MNVNFGAVEIISHYFFEKTFGEAVALTWLFHLHNCKEIARRWKMPAAMAACDLKVLNQDLDVAATQMGAALTIGV